MGVPSRGPLVLVGNIIPFLLGSFFWISRVYSRAVILKTWGNDDWLLAIGWVAALANCIMACMAVRYGAGLHIHDVPSSNLIPATQLSFGTLIVYQASLCFTKLSVCILYLRVFTTSRNGKLLLLGIFGFLVVLNIAAECVCIFQCHPIRGVWNPLVKSACISTIPTFYVYAVSNMVVDTFFMVFAIPKIMGLRMTHRQKYALLATIALGGVPVIASIARCVRVSEILTSSDPTWKSYDTSIWSAIDANVSIICASAPIIKPLLRKVARGFMDSTFVTSRTERSVQFPQGNARGYELHSEPRHSGSQTLHHPELAHSPSQSDWSSEPHKRSEGAPRYGWTSEVASPNEEHGIMKSTHVTVSSIPK
ncbi:hypothetical protein BDV97DRAFT_160337 [Delphinella strobiligena]|nr:hypothetical protein BDV97DRAFT_160337 [Delphinella strobiligena]